MLHEAQAGRLGAKEPTEGADVAVAQASTLALEVG